MFLRHGVEHKGWDSRNPHQEPCCHLVNTTDSVQLLFTQKPDQDWGILVPGDPDHESDSHQNLTVWSLDHYPPLCKISSKAVHNFLSNPDRQVDKQTHCLLLRRTNYSDLQIAVRPSVIYTVMLRSHKNIKSFLSDKAHSTALISVS